MCGIIRRRSLGSSVEEHEGTGIMSQQSDIDTIRRGYAAFSAGDIDTLRNEVFTPEAVWTVPGNGYFSGPKEGVDAILQFFGDIFERSGGTLEVLLDDVAAGDDHCYSLHRNVAMRGERRLDLRSVLVFEIVDERIARVDQYYWDTAENDQFWA
jgi:ketosteroid isomerase-like protein